LVQSSKPVDMRVRGFCVTVISGGSLDHPLLFPWTSVKGDFVAYNCTLHQDVMEEFGKDGLYPEGSKLTILQIGRQEIGGGQNSAPSTSIFGLLLREEAENSLYIEE
jgi:hypothetical protein